MIPVALAIHGGAGRLAKSKTRYPRRLPYEEALARALKAGHELLLKGDSSENAVVASVSVLENEPLFNAGHGAAICHDGSVELSASIMNGKDLSVGAMVGLKHTKNPIQAAQLMIDNPLNGFLFGKHGDDLAEQHGLTMKDQDYFKIPHRIHQWERIKSSRKMVLDHSGKDNDDISDTGPRSDAGPRTENDDGDMPKGTVGAVAIDENGTLAAATSTGGLVNQPPGRVGDSPIIGSGTWADNNSCAISATGTGEAFARVVFAKRVADLIELTNMNAHTAGIKGLQDVKNVGGEGGCIIIDKFGKIYLPFNTSQMLRGWIIGHGKPQVAILPDEQVEMTQF